MDKKIIRIPITYAQRKKNEVGKGYVPCEVSRRYLRFHLSPNFSNSSKWIGVDVMTENTNSGGDRLLCHLIVKREDINNALNEIMSKEST